MAQLRWARIINTLLSVWSIQWARAQSEPDAFVPNAVPLAIRSPYLNAWVGSSNLTPPTWPGTWDGHILGWAGFVRVDETAYQWQGMGGPGERTNFSGFSVTPTRTLFTAVAGPVQLNITFLSPIEISDTVAQSLPFSYLAVDVQSLDGQPHSVQLYSDISGEFVSTNTSEVVRWNTMSTNDVVYHEMRSLDGLLSGQELNELVEGGTVYYGMKQNQRLTWSILDASDSRGTFADVGALPDSIDGNFRPISQAWPILALAVDLGEIVATEEPVVWSLGLVRDPALFYSGEINSQDRYLLFESKYQDIKDAISAFAGDYAGALARAVSLDDHIIEGATAISPDYANLVSLSTRQVFGALDITVSRSQAGSWNTTDVKAFMKDVGITRSVNPLETLYYAFPAFAYVNPTLVGLLLDPLIQYQAFRLPLRAYAAPNLGQAYPAALGNDIDNEAGAVDNTASLLLLAYGHALFSGDGTLIFKYYQLLRKCADYLQENALYPPEFNSVDYNLPANDTNLALKGILAINAMGLISEALDRTDDAGKYKDLAKSYIATWTALAVPSDHIISTYGAQDSWSMASNLYMDRLLKMGLVENRVFSLQETFLASQSTSSSINPFGLPISSRTSNLAKAHWTLFAAGAATDPANINRLIRMVLPRIVDAGKYAPNPASYNPTTGSLGNSAGRSSPVMGAVYAPLALSATPQAIRVPEGVVPHVNSDGGGGGGGNSTIGDDHDDSSAGSGKGMSNAGVIAGTVLGTVFGAFGLLFAALHIWRRKFRAQAGHERYLYAQPGSGAAVAHHKDDIYDGRDAIASQPQITTASAQSFAPVRSNSYDIPPPVPPLPQSTANSSTQGSSIGLQEPMAPTQYTDFQPVRHEAGNSVTLGTIDSVSVQQSQDEPFDPYAASRSQTGASRFTPNRPTPSSAQWGGY